MNATSNKRFLAPSRGKLLGVAAALALLGGTVAMVGLIGTSNTNAAAKLTADATRVVRTNEWLERRGLDPDGSVDMMKALIIACDEIRERGERC